MALDNLFLSIFGGVERMAYQIEVSTEIAKFIIDRPERRNAINTEVADGLERFLNQVEQNEDIAYVVITGRESAFCSGGDLVEYQALRTAEEAFPMLSRMAGLLYRLTTLPVPVIGLVNGTAVGGGCEVAMACDYRLVASEAKAGFIQGTLAITTGWGGATLLMEKGRSHDCSLRLLSEAKLHHAEALVELGWATEVYDGSAEEGLQRFLHQMSTIHPSVHRAYKEVAIRKWKANALYQRMIAEVKACAILWEQDPHHEAVARFLEKK